MSHTKSFLKNYLPTARGVITQPRCSIRTCPYQVGFKEILGFAILTIFIASLLYAPIMLIS